MRTTQASDEERDRAEQRPDPPQRDPVGRDRADRTARVELDERTGRRRLDEPEPEERERRTDHEGEEANAPAPCPVTVPSRSTTTEHEPLQRT